jgi:hypothetical protein
VSHKLRRAEPDSPLLARCGIDASAGVPVGGLRWRMKGSTRGRGHDLDHACGQRPLRGGATAAIHSRGGRGLTFHIAARESPRSASATVPVVDGLGPGSRWRGEQLRKRPPRATRPHPAACAATTIACRSSPDARGIDARTGFAAVSSPTNAASTSATSTGDVEFAHLYVSGRRTAKVLSTVSACRGW